MAKRVAIIGAGASGLAAIKCCLDEDIEPVCFERTDELGGLWNFTEEVREGQACVMRSTVMNSSKEMMSYSDFPTPKEFPNFMHNTHVWEYLKIYTKEFNLNKHIMYNKEVMSVRKSEDYEQTGRWDLQVCDHKSGSKETMTFDAVLVCTGHHASKNVATFPGQEEFEGKILHSHDYKDWTGYMGKRVVVIGIGNSGGDIAVELARVGQVYLSTRSGFWVWPKIEDNGTLFDLSYLRRHSNFLRHLWSFRIFGLFATKAKRDSFDFRCHSIQPQSTNVEPQYVLSDELPFRIATGNIKVKTNIKRFTKAGVEFVDGTFEDNIDVVIMATGYLIDFPFLKKSVIKVQKNTLNLYKYMFQPDLPKQTLAVIGCIAPMGALMPIAEMQCRLATRVFKGACNLPSRNRMLEDIRMKEEELMATYSGSQRHTIVVDFIDFMDELAQLVGCQPQIGILLLSDPKLALECFVGPCTPYQYRLMGPGQWLGARDAIMTQTERMKYPLQTRPLPEGCTDQGPSHRLVTFVLPAVVTAVLYILFV